MLELLHKECHNDGSRVDPMQYGQGQHEQPLPCAGLGICSMDRDSMSSPCHALGWGLTCYA